MRDDEILLPALDVVGGLWMGAYVVDECGERRPYVEGERTLDDPNYAYIKLVLPGELGLGAAGLAARVLHRVWPHLSIINIHRSISNTVSIAIEYGKVPRETVIDPVVVPHADRLFDWHWRHLAAASAYMARVDRLCVLAGVPCPTDVGEVPSWFWHPALRCWILKHSGIETHDHGLTFGVPHPRGSGADVDHGIGATSVDDPLGALATCIAALETR